MGSLKGKYERQNKNENSKWKELREALVTSAINIVMAYH